MLTQAGGSCCHRAAGSVLTHVGAHVDTRGELVVTHLGGRVSTMQAPYRYTWGLLLTHVGPPVDTRWGFVLHHAISILTHVGGFRGWQVEGIKCVSCGMRIKQHVLSHVKGAQNCTVEFEIGKVVVVGRGVSQSELLETISALGYTPRVHSYREHDVPAVAGRPTSRGSEL